ncbi:peptidoglycan/xylan/chitin deacetylase (PgdA/CDA1 family) [Alkalispirillum mobile]|uniref:Peptidoglycan/xylan/chitin deacetylase (PgdA/CDA1 family) n=1 Tax=Alkalispirillum mobile TaxID=85925 RepID=A0A498C5X3_9GAMM|nr:polysaccharide deacetylase family protein [Alkalispirillum mobile]RLK51644.1 peptidoglycan/xylan/chitin deacetylase (PgdA/CDA1 family) [Alkalispirillum mobile]
MIGKRTIRTSLQILSAADLYQRLPDNHNNIIMYHAIGNDGYDAITPKLFKRQIYWLKKHYEITPLNRITEPGKKKKIALTFDDGLTSFLTNALPILRETNSPATVFVIGGVVCGRHADKSNRLMTKQQLLEISRDPLIEIGSHTMTHSRLTESQNYHKLKTEVIDSLMAIEDAIGITVDSFCYPFNCFNKEAREMVSAHYKLAVCGGGHQAFINNDSDPWSLPRINGATNLMALKLRVSDFYKHYNLVT